MFAENFESYADGVAEPVRTAGPRVEARPASRRRKPVADEAPTD